jgi:hypothetical protein
MLDGGERLISHSVCFIYNEKAPSIVSSHVDPVTVILFRAEGKISENRNKEERKCQYFDSCSKEL